MSIININSFESRVSNANYLSNYTDPYLKQSLANLGQRLSTKGDSIKNDSFIISDLFPNYLGDFNQSNIAAEFTWTKSSNNIVGKIVEVDAEETSDKSGTRVPVGYDELNSNINGNANSQFTIESSNNILKNITKDQYGSEIYLNDSTGINGSSYWHRNSAIIARTHDKAIGKDVLIYKVVGHRDSGKYGPYDNEYICEEITVDGEFVDGFRVFMSNESNLMLPENATLTNDASTEVNPNEYEKLVLIRLKKNPSYYITNTNNEHKWLLEAYKCNSNKIDLGDFTRVDSVNYDYEDDLWKKISDTYDADGSLTPSELIDSLCNLMTENTYVFTDDGSPLFTKKYTLQVDENTETNVGWSVASFAPIVNNEICNSVGVGEWYMDDQDDQTMIEEKLEYFVNDASQLFPMVLSVYDDIMYRDSTNIKIKRQIIAQLLLSAKEEASTQYGAKSVEVEDSYSIIMPLDFEVNFTYNSNDSSIIYNSLSSLQVNFIQLGTDKKPGKGIFKYLQKICNYTDADNEQLILAHGTEQKTILYDFIISYVNDNIISSIDWYQSFIVPYIGTDGYWIINGVKTDQYARAISSNGSGIIIKQDTDPNNFDPSSSIIYGPETVKNWDKVNWELKEFAANYMDSNSNVGGDSVVSVYAWVPSNEWLNTISTTDDYSYISNSLLVCSSYVDTMEKDSTENKYICKYDTYTDTWNTYLTTYSFEGTNYRFFKNEYILNNSYIYRIDKKATSLSYLLGKDTLVTSFWTCYEYEENGVKKHEMTYLKRPGGVAALDLSYMMSLENMIAHYANAQYNPDNYQHRWVVFSKVNNDLKNNSHDSSNAVYPVIRNHNSDYFTAITGSYSKSLGNSVEKDVEQYKNNLNFSLEFTDSIQGKIEGTENTYDNRHFDINDEVVVTRTPISYISIDNNGNKVVKVDSEATYKRYGTIPKSIPYTKYPKEYVPNSIYNANDDVSSTDSYQYPIFDLSEVLAKNLTTLNRYNIMGIGRESFNGTDISTILWNAYFGVAHDTDDKSRLKIGSGNVNPNLGTTTMVHNPSQCKLTPMDTFDIDMSYTNINGDVNVKGHLFTNNASWEAHYVNGGNKQLCAYSTIVTPIGSHKTSRVDMTYFDTTGDNSLFKSYSNENIGAENCLFHTLSVTNDGKDKRYNTRYYNNYDGNYSVSYLNLTKLLEENHVVTDFGTIFLGDSSRLSKRYKKNDDIEKVIDLIKIQNGSHGVFCTLYDLVILNKGNILSGAGNPNEEWYNWLLDNYSNGENGWEGKLQNLLSDYKEYIKINPYGNKYKLIGNEEYVLCQKNRTSSTEPIEEKWMKIPEAGWSKKITDEPYVSTEGLPLYESANYLELSTDLNDNENIIGNDKSVNFIVGNPVVLSYMDVPGSYTGTFDVSSVKRIYTYAYVDGTKNPKGGYKLKYENSKYILPEDFANYSYNEVWTCDGCEKCSQYSCNMIQTCTKSKVQGSYLLSYGNFICTYNEDPVSYMNEKTTVYRRRVERYNTDESGNSYKYVTYSYYPSYESIPVSEISVENENTLLGILTIGKDPDGTRYVLNKNQHVVKYDNNDDILASYVYVGRNILCPTQEEYIHEYSPKLPKGYSMSYSVGAQQIRVNYVDEKGTKQFYDVGIKEANTYWEVPNRYSVDGKPYSGWKMMTELPGDYDKSSKFSYYGEVIIPQEYSLSYRYINVRELLTNNTIPQFYDNYEKDYNKFKDINIQPDKLIPSEPDKSLTDIYHKEPATNTNKPSGKLRLRVCELCRDANGTSYNKTELEEMLNKIYRLYTVDWSNTTGKLDNNNYEGLETIGLENIYVICYDKIYNKEYKIVGNEWVYDEKATTEGKTYQTESCHPKLSIDKYSKLAKYTFTMVQTNNTNVYKLEWNVTEDMLKTFKDNVKGNIVISNEDQQEITIKLKGTYTPKESVRYKFTVYSSTVDGNVNDSNKAIKFIYRGDDASERFYNVTSYYENLVDWENVSGLKYWVGCTALKYDDEHPDGQRSTYFESILDNISDNNTTKRYRVHQTNEAKQNKNPIFETWKITPNKYDVKNSAEINFERTLNNGQSK
nr:MAG TPA: hypothetical protein [Ackermannviridae sp.]